MRTEVQLQLGIGTYMRGNPLSIRNDEINLHQWTPLQPSSYRADILSAFVELALKMQGGHMRLLSTLSSFIDAL